MKFLQFCQRITTPFIVVENLSNDAEMTPDVRGRVSVLCHIMKPKMEILDRVEIPFIEALFHDMDVVEDIMEQEYNCNVPDYLLREFSTELYGLDFASLNADQQAIIKTLSVYICISPFRDKIK